MKLTRSLKYNSIQRKLGIKFKHQELLKLALTHSSYAQGKNKKSNETLEFLGDAILELVVREHLFKKYPKSREGELSELKKIYTSEEALHAVGKSLGIGSFILMDKGEELTGGRNRESNIAGCLEAIIGASYLDQGLNITRKFIRNKILKKRIEPSRDYKSLVNNWAMCSQAKIIYKVVKEEGPPHNKIFHIGLYINKVKKTEGIGSTKKKAEQEAARIFLADIAGDKII